MTTLLSLGSSSKGNAYVLKCDGDILLLECGIAIENILRAIEYTTANVSGMLLSHRHLDHSKYAKDAARFFNMYSTPDVAERDKGVKPLLHRHKYKIGNFTVTPLEVEHPDPCYAYVIEHGGERIVFCTDATNFPYDIKNVTALLLECNYSTEIVAQKMMAGEDVRSRYDGHCELTTATEVINRLRGPKLNKVVLLHLSDSLSDERAFVEHIRLNAFVTPEVADVGTKHFLSEDF